MRYSRAVIERFYARRAHTCPNRQQVNTNDLREVSASQPFFPPGRTTVQVQVSRPHACHLHITSSIQTNLIYNIIYSLNIMISKRLHLFK